jgi:hypothetical protein
MHRRRARTRQTPSAGARSRSLWVRARRAADERPLVAPLTWCCRPWLHHEHRVRGPRQLRGACRACRAHGAAAGGRARAASQRMPSGRADRITRPLCAQRVRVTWLQALATATACCGCSYGPRWQDFCCSHWLCDWRWPPACTSPAPAGATCIAGGAVAEAMRAHRAVAPGGSAPACARARARATAAAPSLSCRLLAAASILRVGVAAYHASYALRAGRSTRATRASRCGCSPSWPL